MPRYSPVIEGYPWAFIAVMGVTGAGKSTFIKAASGDYSVVIGHDLTSCTSELKGYNFHFGGYNISLLDSPGFNDTFKTETEVLGDIAKWLSDSYREGTKLSGIIYMHSIKDERMTGSGLRNLKMFRELCGDEPLKNVVLVTSFWDTVSQDLGNRREEQLRNNPQFWSNMVRKGSTIARFDGRDSALSIIVTLVSQNPLALSIQREIVEDKKELIDTAAGIAVNEELARLEAKHKKEKISLQQQFEEALAKQDDEYKEILRKEQERVDEELERVHRQQQMLKAQRRADQRRWDNNLDQLRNEIDLSTPKTPDNSIRQLLPSHSHQLQTQQNWDDLDYVVSVVRANEIKIKPEERFIVELKIRDVKEKQGPAKLSKTRKQLGKVLLQSLRVILPATSIALLGIPIVIPANVLGST